MTTAYDARAAALHRHLDTQIENLERKNYHNRELITDLKKQKLRCFAMSFCVCMVKEMMKEKNTVKKRFNIIL